MGQPGLYTIQLVLTFGDGRPGVRKQAEQAASLPALGLTHSRAGAPRAGPDVTRGSTSKTTETTTLTSRTGWGCCGSKAQDVGGGAQAAAAPGFPPGPLPPAASRPSLHGMACGVLGATRLRKVGTMLPQGTKLARNPNAAVKQVFMTLKG